LSSGYGLKTVYFKVKNAGDESNTKYDQINYEPSAPTVLTWTGEPGYGTDGVNPDQGNVGSSFEFRVKYSDSDGDAPADGYPKLHIKKADAEISGSPFAMTPVGTNANYTTGRIYSFTTNTLTTGTDYSYWFEAQDVNGNGATGEPTQSQTGPIVTNPGGNNKCLYVVSTPDPIIMAILNESGINITTSATIPADLSPYNLVICREYSACTPTTAPYIGSFVQSGGGAILMGGTPSTFGGGGYSCSNISAWFGTSQYSDVGVSNGKVAFDNPLGTSLNKDDVIDHCGGGGGAAVKSVSSDAIILANWDYSSGNIFSFIRQYQNGRVAFWAGGVSYNEKERELFKAICQWIVGTNSSPQLTWTGEPGYETDGVNPDQGNVGSSFEFRVKYSDPDGNAPADGYPKVHIKKGDTEITSSPFTMNKMGTGTDYVAGQVYSYVNNTMTAGTDYSYWFEAQDGNGNVATGEATLSKSGAVVNAVRNLLSLPTIHSTANAANVRIPINLKNEDALSSLGFVINFPTDKIEATGLESSGRTKVSVQSGGIDNTRGKATFSVVDLSGGEAIPAGDGLIGNFLVNIKSGIDQTAIELVIDGINNAFSSGGSQVDVSAINGQIIIDRWLLGDADNDQKLTALDAIFIFRTVTGLPPIPASVNNPNLPGNEVISGYVNQYGDYNEDGSINALDAIDVFRYATGLPARNTSSPKSLVSHIAGNSSLTFDIYHVDKEKGEITIGIRMDNAVSLSTFGINLRYDPSLVTPLQLKPAERLVKAFEGGWIDKKTHTLHIVSGDLQGKSVLEAGKGYVGFIRLKMHNSGSSGLMFESYDNCYSIGFREEGFTVDDSALKGPIKNKGTSSGNVPVTYSLACYPNPFNSQVSINIDLAKRGEYRVELYNIVGQRVKTILSGQVSAGHYTLRWNGVDEIGNFVESGIYICRLIGKDVIKNVKLVYVK